MAYVLAHNALPFVLKILLNRRSSFLTKYCISLSTLNSIEFEYDFNLSSKDFSSPEIPLLLSSIYPII